MEKCTKGNCSSVFLEEGKRSRREEKRESTKGEFSAFHGAFILTGEEGKRKRAPKIRTQSVPQRSPPECGGFLWARTNTPEAPSVCPGVLFSLNPFGPL